MSFVDLGHIKRNVAAYIQNKTTIRVTGLVSRTPLNFIHITDHTDSGTLQIVVEESDKQGKPAKKLYKGTRITAVGILIKPPCEKSKEPYELMCAKWSDIVVTGPIRQPDTFLPAIATKDTKMDIWRGRPSERVGAPSIRMKLKIADFLNYQLTCIAKELGAVHADPSEITGADCEGAGEMFTVTTAIEDDGTLDMTKVKVPNVVDFCILAEFLKHYEDENLKDEEIQLRRPDGSRVTTKIEAQQRLMKTFIQTHVKIQPEKDHFRKPHMAKLTVSSQLGLERMVKYIPFVWTMNKSFRAEQSDTNRHLAEFTHFEMEKANISYKELMDLIEMIVTKAWKSLLAGEGKGLLETLESVDPEAKGVIEKLTFFSSKPFVRISYEHALKVLQEHKDDLIKKFPTMKNKLPVFGDDLGSSCERYLSEVHYKQPLFVTDMPWPLKSFYMKRNAGKSPRGFGSNQTVQGVDLLVPYMGELVGGSIREEDWSQMVVQLIEKRLYRVQKRKPSDQEHAAILLELQKEGKEGNEGKEGKEGNPPAAEVKETPVGAETHIQSLLKTFDIDFGTCNDYLALRYNAAVSSGGFGLGFARLVNICTTGAQHTGLVRDTIAEPVAWKYLES